MTAPSLPAIGTLFTRERAGDPVETRPCPTCAEPIADTNRGPVHFEVLPNGGMTAYDECRTGDQGVLFGLGIVGE